MLLCWEKKTQPDVFQAVLKKSDQGDTMIELMTHLHLVRLIEHNPIFSELTGGEIDSLARLVEYESFAPSAVIHQGGDVPLDHMYLVVQGVVKVPSASLFFYRWRGFIFSNLVVRISNIVCAPCAFVFSSVLSFLRRLRWRNAILG